MIKKGKMPITGTNTAMRPKKPVLTDANTPSEDAQRMIKQPPQPFANPKGPVNLPVAKKQDARGTEVTAPHKVTHGVKAPATPSGGAVGQRRPISQSGQVYGPKGISHPKKKGSFFPGSFKSKKNASFYGE